MKLIINRICIGMSTLFSTKKIRSSISF
ncbi:hypothetical protein GASC598B02_003770, partial [Gilliamella apicola SCGC AB-598-B02]